MTLSRSITLALCCLVAGAAVSCAPDRSTEPVPVAQPEESKPVNPPPPPPEQTPGTSGSSDLFVWSPERGRREIPLPAGARALGAADMNDAGEVAGVIVDANGLYAELFIWSEAKGMRRLGAVDGGFTGHMIVTGINAGGTVAGYKHGFVGAQIVPFVGNEAGGLTTIPGILWASGINDGGFVAANGSGPARWHPQRGVEPLQKMSAQCTGTTSINNRGDVLGWSGDELPGWLGCNPQAWIVWKDGGPPTAITTCPQGCSLDLRAINDARIVVGGMDGHAVRFDASHFESMQTIPNAFVQSINEAGDAAGGAAPVGSSDPNHRIPIIWKADGTIVRIPIPDGHTRGFAVAINNRGEVVGWSR